MSPWAATQANPPNTWHGAALWGSDIEEPRPDLLIRELARRNLADAVLDSLATATNDGYRRASAPRLLQLARRIGHVKDDSSATISLKTQLLRTLEVESLRADRSAGRLTASALREQVMKEFFLAHYRAAQGTRQRPRFIVNFGQNHMGRGIDLRGVSTLGNFIAELAAGEGTQSFHVLLFAAGGKINYGGGIQEIDQRTDAEAFAFLASLARFPATVFDLRPLRLRLHNLMPPLSPRDESLRYWADGYDAVICYRAVTPLAKPRPY